MTKQWRRLVSPGLTLNLTKPSSLVEQRAIATEKVGQVVTVLVDKGSLVYAVVYEKAQDYEVAAYLEATFEGVGRSIIWIGDAVAELAGGRFCCFKVCLTISSSC